jgi:hypothetical protein
MAFISEIADYIINNKNYSLTQDSLTIIFPNKRAALMLRKELAKIIEKNIWLPQILSIQEAMSSWSKIQLIENIDVIFELLTIMNPQSITWSKDLFGIASQMAKDFDEIDQYNVDAENLFAYLKVVKSMETWSPDDKTMTPVESEYINFFKKLIDYYNDLRKKLSEKNYGYYGLITRKLANLNDEELVKTVGNNKIIFAGFNAMTATEEDIIVRLVDNGKAEILWDLDKYYFDNEKQEAGLFARAFFNKHKNIKKTFIGDNFHDKTINVIGASGATIQTNALQIKLNEKEQGNTVVVLSDETLLIPVLNSIPSNYNDIQVTMGYPYSKTIVNQFLLNLFSFQNYINVNENKVYFWELKRLLETEIVKIIFTYEELSSLSKSIDSLIKQSTYYIEINKLSDFFNNKRILEFTECLCKKWNVENCIDSIGEILTFIIESPCANKDFIANQISVAKRIFNKIHKLMKKYGSIIQLTDIETIYRQSANEMSIKLESQNEGLQIMGLLETRNLDFDVVHILSVNEGILPQSKNANSLIPFDLRKEYNLPIYKNKQAVYAYHFYRLLQNAKTINIYYNTLADGMGEGEPSRFIRQIIHEMSSNNNINIIDTTYKNPKIEINKNSGLKVSKKDIIDKIKNKIAPQKTDGEIKGLSPTSISCYLKCPMQFYLKYIENVQDNSSNELIQSNVIGSIIHSTFEYLYNNFESTEIDDKIYNQIVDKELKNSYHKALIENKFANGLPSTGFNYLSEVMINDLINNFINYEKKFLQNNKLKIIGLEKKLHHTFNIDKDTNVNLIGFADRIDMVNDKMIRILDYKSGSVDYKDVVISKNASKLSDLSDKSLQLLIYKYLYKKMYPNTERNIEPAIIGLLKMNEVILPLNNLSTTFDDDNFIAECDEMFLNLFNEILDVNVDFTQTEDESKCRNCSYCDICKRDPKSL